MNANSRSKFAAKPTAVRVLNGKLSKKMEIHRRKCFQRRNIYFQQTIFRRKKIDRNHITLDPYWAVLPNSRPTEHQIWSKRERSASMESMRKGPVQGGWTKLFSLFWIRWLFVRHKWPLSDSTVDILKIWKTNLNPYLSDIAGGKSGRQRKKKEKFHAKFDMKSTHVHRRPFEDSRLVRPFELLLPLTPYTLTFSYTTMISSATEIIRPADQMVDLLSQS